MEKSKTYHYRFLRFAQNDKCVEFYKIYELIRLKFGAPKVEKRFTKISEVKCEFVILYLKTNNLFNKKCQSKKKLKP